MSKSSKKTKQEGQEKSDSRAESKKKKQKSSKKRKSSSPSKKTGNRVLPQPFAANLAQDQLLPDAEEPSAAGTIQQTQQQTQGHLQAQNDLQGSTLPSNAAIARTYRKSLLKTAKQGQEGNNYSNNNNASDSDGDEDSTGFSNASTISTLTNPTFVTQPQHTMQRSSLGPWPEENPDRWDVEILQPRPQESIPGAFALRPSGPELDGEGNQPLVSRRTRTMDNAKGQGLTNGTYHSTQSPPVSSQPAPLITNQETNPHVIAARLVEDEEDMEARLRQEMEERFQRMAQSMAPSQNASNDSFVPHAEVVRINPEAASKPSILPTEDGNERKTRRRLAWILAACLLLIVVVGVAVGVTILVLDKEANQLAPSEAPITLAPDAGPSDSSEPVLSPAMREALRKRLQEIFLVPSGEAVNDPNSPQRQTLELMVENAGPLVAEASEEELVQTYIVILFYVSTDGRNWKDQNNFLTTADICQWNNAEKDTGVFCNDFGVVTELNIFENNLQGQLISELGFLSGLETLRLNSNALTGTIPLSLVGLQSLQGLFLYDNALQGTIPNPIRLLRELRILDLSTNLLTGPIPVPSQIQRKLLRIDLSENEGLTGQIQQVWNAMPTTLREFSCSGCLLFRNFESPDWDRLQNLEVLDISFTGASGSIPDQLSSLSKLRVFIANNNELTGTIPTGVARLPDLEAINVHDNQLSGPVPILSSPKVRVFGLDLNFFEGNLGETLLALPSATLEEFWVGNNLITGRIPSQIGRFTNMQGFSIAFNSITGTIPSGVRFWIRLREMYVQGNRLQGRIPKVLGEISSLEVLYLHDNAFVDNINDLCSTDFLSLTADCALSGAVECNCCRCYNPILQEFE